MAEVKRRKYVIKSLFDGMPKREDLEIVEETLPPLKDGGMHEHRQGGGALFPPPPPPPPPPPTFWTE